MLRCERVEEVPADVACVADEDTLHDEPRPSKIAGCDGFRALAVLTGFSDQRLESVAER
jgi:hypothetical protein